MLIYSKPYLRRYFGNSRNKGAYLVDLFISFFIFLSVIIYIADTYLTDGVVKSTLLVLDYFILVLFTIEFFVRWYVLDNGLRYFKSVYTWIDFLSVFPFWLGLSNLQFFRILRFFKLFRYYEKYLNLGHLLDHKRFEKLFVLKIVFTLTTILFISSSLIYTVEKDQNPLINTFGDAFYFSVVTVTTVGYGDITPVTDAGKRLVVVIILSGVILIPWYLGTLMKFLVMHSKKKHILCKSCGLTYHDMDAVFCKACGKKIFHKHDGEL